MFNELEHDIGYKDHDAPPTSPELEELDDVRCGVRMLDRSVERLLIQRADSIRKQKVPLKDAEELQFALEQAVGRRLTGEFARLFRLLGSVVDPLTSAALTRLGSVEELLDRGSVSRRASRSRMPTTWCESPWPCSTTTRTNSRSSCALCADRPHF